MEYIRNCTLKLIIMALKTKWLVKVAPLLLKFACCKNHIICLYQIIKENSLFCVTFHHNPRASLRFEDATCSRGSELEAKTTCTHTYTMQWIDKKVINQKKNDTEQRLQSLAMFKESFLCSLQSRIRVGSKNTAKGQTITQTRHRRMNGLASV